MTPEQAIALARARRAREMAQQNGSGAADRIAAAKAGTLQVSQEALDRAAAADRIAEDQMTLSGVPKFGGTAAKMIQGLPFAGEWVDEGFDKLDPGRGERLREIQGAMDRQHPKASLAAEVGGGILGAIPLAIGAAGHVMEKTTRAGRVVSGLATGVGAGAAEGALAGAGRNDEDRVSGAIVGAGTGAAIGGLSGALAPIVGEFAQGVVKKAKKLDVKSIAEEFGVSPKAAKVVKSHLINDDAEAAMAALQRAGDDSMLADAGLATGQLLDTSASGGGKALQIARSRVEARAAKAGQQLSATLDNILGPAEGLKAAQTNIAKRTAAQRDRLYNAAWARPIDYGTGGKGEKVLSALQRIPAKYLQPAIEAANNRGQMEAIDGFKQILASVGDDGVVRLSELPNTLQLHFIKSGLDDIVSSGTDSMTGKLSPDAVAASKVAKLLRDALKDANPTYAAATKVGGDKIAEENALLLGKRLLRKNTTFEDALGVMRGASTEAKAAAKQGLRQHIEDTLSNVRRTVTDPNSDAREAFALVKEMSSRANMKKARLVLGTDAKALFDELDRAEAALALRAAISRNSATAIRQAGQQEIAAQAQPGLARRVVGKSGGVTSAAEELTSNLAGIDPASIAEGQAQILTEIADALTRLRGPDAQRALAAVQRAMQGQPMKDAEAEAISRLLAGSAAGLSHQGAMQTLER